MKTVRALVYRYLTDNDFFTIYKPTGTESGGGGQLYIDFPTSQIPATRWQQFFAGVTGIAQNSLSNGPQWKFPIHSIGFPASPQQTLRIYQRRAASICIPNQNINTRSANRVRAWLPANHFPVPADPSKRGQLPGGLAVFFVRTEEKEVWAGWFQNSDKGHVLCRDAASRLLLSPMVAPGHSAGDSEIVSFHAGDLLLDEMDPTSPFAASAVGVSATSGGTGSRAAEPMTVSGSDKKRPSLTHRAKNRRQRTEDEILGDLFSEDEADPAGGLDEPVDVIVKVKKRNQKAVRGLKELYRCRCQLTAEEHTFMKKDGTPYVEAHHLLPLGSGGADNPRNMIIVSPLIHRMLHYADVGEIDLNKIVQHSDGSASLDITINAKTYTIKWHAQHANRIMKPQ